MRHQECGSPRIHCRLTAILGDTALGKSTTPSVNDAFVQIPDLWTDKIQNLMIKVSTAKRLGLADDLTSISMTRVIWREGGAGTKT